MPVRNEARFLDAALKSLVNQTGVGVEIIISDNASTDDTGAICQRFCATYPHIRYHRFDSNVGASQNFHKVLHDARGEYFMWASGHDLWDSNFLVSCSDALKTNAGAVIAFGTTRWIDAEGQPYPRSTGWCDTRGMSIMGRYFSTFWGNMNAVIALIRTKELKEQKVENMAGLDLAILLSLALKGDFIHVWQTGWSRREFRTETDYKQKLQRYRSPDYALTSSWLSRHFPLARLPVRIITDLFSSQLGLGNKLMILQILLCSLPVKYWVDKTRKGTGDEASSQ